MNLRYAPLARNVQRASRRTAPVVPAIIAVSMALAAGASQGSDKNGKQSRSGRPNATAASDLALAEELKAAFDDGYVYGAGRLKEAERHLALARKLASPDDWRLDYALGLVYVRQSQMTLAIAQFETAARRGGPAEWRVWRTLLWSRFVARQNDEGLQGLAEFATAVKTADRPDDLSADRRDAACWIGQLLESLARCAESRKLRDQIEQQAARLLEILGEELAESVETGRELIRDRELALGRESDSEDAQEKARKKEADKIGKTSAGIKDAKEKNARTADEWKTWLDQARAKFDKQLEKLEVQYQDLEQQAALAMQNYFRATMTGTPRGPLGTNVLDKMNELETWRAQYNVAMARRSAVIEQAMLTSQQREAAIRDYNQATGKIFKENTALDKWSARLNDQKQKLNANPPGGQAANKGNAKKANAVPAEKKQQLTLKTFFPLNLERERDWVLESYAVTKPAAGNDPSEK